MKKISFWLLLLQVLIAAFIVSCGNGADTTTSPADTGTPMPVDNVEVTIENYEYTPPSVTIPIGTTVTWRNIDPIQHTATARDNEFDSGLLGQNEIFSFTFNDPGEYEYYCTLHPYMIGTIIVE